jgi:hypothetical protein
VTSVPFFLLFFAVVVTWAAWRGGGPERVTAFAYVVALAGTISGGFLQVPGQFRVVPVHLFIVDLLLLIGICIIAIRANRWWPIPAAGCQLVAVLVHAGKLIQPGMIPNSYAFLATIWSWPMVALLGLGTWAHRRRVRDGVSVPHWKPSFAQRQSPSRPQPQ